MCSFNVADLKSILNSFKRFNKNECSKMFWTVGNLKCFEQRLI